MIFSIFSLKRTASGKKLQYGDANVLLNSIVSAMFLENSTHEDEITELPFLYSLEPFMKWLTLLKDQLKNATFILHWNFFD